MYQTVTDDIDERIWKVFLCFAGETFKTTKGLPFTYHPKISRNGEASGEIVIDRRGKTITRSTVLLAYHNALDIMEKEGCVSGPKKLGVFGASYIYPVFLEIGICRKDKTNSLVMEEY